MASLNVAVTKTLSHFEIRQKENSSVATMFHPYSVTSHIHAASPTSAESNIGIYLVLLLNRR